MSCSPSNLFVDMTIWGIPGITDGLVMSYQNLSDGDMYDCALKSVPCESDLLNVLTSSNPTLVYWFDFIVIYVFLTVVVVIGIFGNISNIIIFSTNNVATDSTNNLLLSLSVSDLMNILSLVTLMTSFYMCFLDVSTALTSYNIIFPQVTIASGSLTLLSLDFVTVISTQRAVAVFLPFKLSTIFSNRNTNIIITALVLLHIIMVIPMHIGFIPDWMYHPYFRKQISLGLQFPYGFKSVVSLFTYYSLFRSALDLVLISVTGSLTVFKLKQHAQNRLTLKAGTSVSLETTAGPTTSTRETKVIKMSLTVCFVTFIVCCVAITTNVIAHLYQEELFRSPISSFSEYGLMALASINSSFNFFLYLKMSDKFRAIFTTCYKCTGKLKQHER